MGLNKSNIDYLREADDIIGRPGYSYNIVTGCRHGCPWCWAKELVGTRLKDSPAYPYGFEPTFHPERIKKIGGVPKLIALNFMGDVGGNWNWRDTDPVFPLKWTPSQIVLSLLNFAELNPGHILLLLTKNPAWYALADWPENVWCGFSASNNAELRERNGVIWNGSMRHGGRVWTSLEPWLDNDAPYMGISTAWIVIGGLSGRNPQPVSEDTIRWIESYQGKLFVKRNTWGQNFDKLDLSKPMEIQKRHEYPDFWRVP